MRILMLCTYDRGGGAEKVAFKLHESYHQQGHDTRFLVRYKKTDSRNTHEADPYAYASSWAPLCSVLEQSIRSRPSFPGQYRLCDWLRRVALPQRIFDHLRGIEDFNYPYSTHLLENSSWSPDVIHAHNLHGDYFDLSALALLSRQIPLIWTLHDAWAFTGHCAQFADIGCTRWRTGCGKCPDLKRPPAVLRDRTAENWARKRKVYLNSKLAVATPSQWLMNYVRESILLPWQMRVIPNGVDLSVLKPGARDRARAALGLPQDASICLFIAPSGGDSNPYKDYPTVERAAKQAIALAPNRQWIFFCIGGNARHSSDPRFRFVRYVEDSHLTTLYYQAADLLLHAANVETFPCVVLEALACGTPVVASSVGGIPEQVEDGTTGFLVPRGDSNMMATRILGYFDNPELRSRMRINAFLHASHLDLRRQSTAYLEWFEELRTIYEPTEKDL